MKKGIFIGIVVLGSVSLMFSSCTKLLQKDLDMAKAAFEQAKLAGAEIYAYDAYLSLQESLDSVVLNLESKNTKFIKQYTSTREQLEDITKLAGALRQHVETRKEELKGEIKNTMEEVNTLIKSNRRLILEAPETQKTAVMQIKTEIDEIEKLINETDTVIDPGDYLANLDKIKVAKEKITSIQSELSSSAAKNKTNNKKRT